MKNITPKTAIKSSKSSWLLSTRDNDLPGQRETSKPAELISYKHPDRIRFRFGTPFSLSPMLINLFTFETTSSSSSSSRRSRVPLCAWENQPHTRKSGHVPAILGSARLVVGAAPWPVPYGTWPNPVFLERMIYGKVVSGLAKCFNLN